MLSASWSGKKSMLSSMRLKRGLDCVPFAFPSSTRSSGNQRGHVPGHGKGKATSRCAALAAKAGDGFITGNRRHAKQKRVRMRGIFHCEPRGVKWTSRLARITRPTSPVWLELEHAPARRRGGTIGWPLLCPAQHLDHSKT